MCIVGVSNMIVSTLHVESITIVKFKFHHLCVRERPSRLAPTLEDLLIDSKNYVIDHKA